MQDSEIVYRFRTDGVQQTSSELKFLQTQTANMLATMNAGSPAAKKLVTALNDTADGANKSATAVDRASKSQQSYFAHIAKTTVQSALINKLFLELVDVMGQSIQQVDLMNNFPATMASLGQSVEVSNQAFQALRDYVGQVGGNLADATSAVTRFTGVTGNVKSAVAIFTGLNNALIAGDSSMEEQRLAAIQFAQAFERGKPDMKEWLSLTQNMSNQLNLVAKEMGYVNASSLGEALRTGEESMGAFTTELTQLATGTGPIAQQALARMSGMQFAFNVMKNTMVQGLAAIINAFGRTNIVSFFNFLTQVIQVVTQAVVGLINAFFGLINAIRGLFGLSPLEGLKKDAEVVTDAAGGIGDGLKDAKKDADKLNKSLAGFDKMNVLPDKTSGKGNDDDAAGAGTSLNDAEMGKLADAFGSIGNKLQEVSIWAKIFAGILGGIAATKFGLFMVDQFNQAIDSAKKFKTNISDIGTKLDDMGKKAKTNFGTIGSAMGSALGKAGGGVSTAVSSFVGGIIGAITTTLWPALSGLFGAIGTAIASALAGLAATLGVPIWAVVAIIAAVVAAIVAIVWLIASNWDAIVKFITDVFTGFWNWLVSLWNTLYDIFKGPIEWIWQFISATFILIVAIIATALEVIFNLVVWAVKGILDILGTIGKWIWDNVIVPVGKFFADLWNGLVKIVTDTWNWIFNNILAPVGMWIYNNVVAPVVNFFKNMWTTILNFVMPFVVAIQNLLRPIVNWINQNIIGPIANFFSGLWNGIRDGLAAMINGLASLFGNIVNIAKAPINGVIDLINGALGGLNNIKVPDWVPGIGGSRVNFPKIPRLARGGVIDRATVLMAGEAGDEAIVPLENNLEWLDKLAAKINSTGNGDGRPVNLTIQIGEEKIVSRVIDLVNDQTFMSGRNRIVV